MNTLRQKSFLLAPLLVFTFVVLATAALNRLNYTWAGWRPATCLPSNCFCEATREGALIRQPANTYSNLSFVLTGLLILGFSQARSSGLSRPPRAHSIVYGLAVTAIGAGSFFYHASLTFTGQWFDLMGMYLLATFIVLYNLSRLRSLGGLVFAVSYVIFNIILGIVLALNPAIRIRIFSGLILIGLALEVIILLTRRPRIKTRYFIASLTVFILAYTIWTLDKNGTLCAPDSLLQGHALWHVLTALAAGLLFVYYRSESGPQYTNSRTS
jgi:hypothetical protein